MSERTSHRLEALERSRVNQHRLLLALLCAALFVAAQPSRDVVSARAFHLVDGSGRLVARLAADEGVGLTLLDDQGRARVRLVHDPEQSGLFILDEAEHPRIGVAQFAHGGGGVAIHGPEGKGAAVLYRKERGTLTFYDVDGAVTARFPTE